MKKAKPKQATSCDAGKGDSSITGVWVIPCPGSVPQLIKYVHHEPGTTKPFTLKMSVPGLSPANAAFLKSLQISAFNPARAAMDLFKPGGITSPGNIDPLAPEYIVPPERLGSMSTDSSSSNKSLMENQSIQPLTEREMSYQDSMAMFLHTSMWEITSLQDRVTDLKQVISKMERERDFTKSTVNDAMDRLRITNERLKAEKDQALVRISELIDQLAKNDRSIKRMKAVIARTRTSSKPKAKK